MSLDVYLEIDKPVLQEGGIYIREVGRTVRLTREEWDRRFPGREPMVTETDIDFTVYHGNITHNLNRMAEEAGIYKHLWRPDEIGIERAVQLIVPLTEGALLLQSEPDRFKPFNPENGWGSYEVLLGFVLEYLAACVKHPLAVVRVWR